MLQGKIEPSGMKNLLLFGISMLFFASCSPRIASLGKEDLSKYRHPYAYQRTELPQNQESIVIDIPLIYDSSFQKNDITARLNNQLNKRPIKTVCNFPMKKDGFRIQIYYGNSREDALAARQMCYKLFPSELIPYMTYRKPDFRVSLGDFMNLKATTPYLARLKKDYPDARAVPATIRVWSR